MRCRMSHFIVEIQERSLLTLGALSERAFDRLCRALVNPTKHVLLALCLVSLGQAIDRYALLGDEMNTLRLNARGLGEYAIGERDNSRDSDDSRRDGTLDGAREARGQVALATINSIAVESGVHVEAVATGGACQHRASLSQSQIQILFRAEFSQIRELYDRIMRQSDRLAVESLVVERANSSGDVSTITGRMCVEVVTKSSLFPAKFGATDPSTKQLL